MTELSDEEAFRIAYGKWQEHVIASELEPFMKMLNSTSSIASWYRAIKNSCMTGYSNGFVEGYHNKIKVLKRICFGVRNFERFRNRISLYCSCFLGAKRQTVFPLPLILNFFLYPNY